MARRSTPAIVRRRDAACVALAREAGAVVLGKTVTTEFALRHPGATANPRNPAHTPGGSSSGSAAAVADLHGAGGVRDADRRLDHPPRVVLRRGRLQAVVRHDQSDRREAARRQLRYGGPFRALRRRLRSWSSACSPARRGSRGRSAPAVARRPVQDARVVARGAATVRAVESAARQLVRAGVTVDESRAAGRVRSFLDAQSDVLRFEAARVFAFERTQRADLLAASSRGELERALRFRATAISTRRRLIAAAERCSRRPSRRTTCCCPRVRRVKRRAVSTIRARRCSTAGARACACRASTCPASRDQGNAGGGAGDRRDRRRPAPAARASWIMGHVEDAARNA